MIINRPRSCSYCSNYFSINKVLYNRERKGYSEIEKRSIREKGVKVTTHTTTDYTYQLH